MLTAFSDPKGLLFYHAQSDFKVGEAEYRVYYHSEASPLITVRVDFYVPGETVVFARVRIVLMTAFTFVIRLTNCHPLTVPRKG